MSVGSSIGLDSVNSHFKISGRKYWEVDKHLKDISSGNFRPNKNNPKIITDGYITCDNFKIKFHLVKNLQVCISASFPKVLFGDNVLLVDHLQAKQVIDIVSDIIQLDYSKFALNRLDISSTLNVPFSLEDLMNVARSPKNHDRILKDSMNGLYFGTVQSKAFDKMYLEGELLDEINNRYDPVKKTHHNRVFVYYNKNKSNSSCVRIEARVFTGSKIKQFLSKHSAGCFNSSQALFPEKLPSINSLQSPSTLIAGSCYLKTMLEESLRRFSHAPYAVALKNSFQESFSSTLQKAASSFIC